jgi:RNA polymerase sigma-70 factor (ECF subfamily)
VCRGLARGATTSAGFRSGDRAAATVPESLPRDHRAAQPDAGVIAAAVSGDPAATQALLSYLRPLVFRYCLSRLRSGSHDRMGIEDCTQEVLLAVLTALPGYRLSTGKFLAFVFGIARHKVVDSYRRRAGDRADSVADVAMHDRGGRDAGYEEIEQRHTISRLLDKLPVSHREVLAMRVIFGYSAEETAVALGMSSAGAVRVVQHRALTALRREMGAEVVATAHRSAGPQAG